jgi:hypothetical protein
MALAQIALKGVLQLLRRPPSLRFSETVLVALTQMTMRLTLTQQQ